MEGLIILFIKLQFSNQVHQAFRPLRTSISISISTSSSTSRPRHSYHPRYASFMIPDLAYTSRGLYASNQVRSRPTYSSGLGATGLHTRGLRHLVNALTSTESVIRTVALTKLTSAQGRSPSCVQLAFHPHRHQGCSTVVHPTTRRVGDLQEG